MQKRSFSARAILIPSVVLLCLALLVPSIGVPAKAEPQWGPLEPWFSLKVTASGIHFVKDPLVVAGTLPTPTPGLPTPTLTPTVVGSVRFVCFDERVPPRLPRGFQYHIVVEGLSPNAAYMARAYPLPYSTGEEGAGPPSQDFGIVPFYELGTIHTNAKGDGRFSGFIDLGTGVFSYRVTVELGGTVILTTLPAFTYYDPSLDTPEFPLGTFLWYFGDHVDGYVVG